MLEPRSGHTATLLPDGRVLIAGGMRRNQDFYHSAELFDPATGKFSATGEMQIARVGHAAVLLRSGKVLIAGGWIGHGVTDEAELYDPATGKFTVIGPMVTKRGRPEATLLRDANVLVTGGGGNTDSSGSSITNAEISMSQRRSFALPAQCTLHGLRIRRRCFPTDGCWSRADAVRR
jgi:galactose oxidase-like protein